jgi:hypothetical protein
MGGDIKILLISGGKAVPKNHPIPAAAIEAAAVAGKSDKTGGDVCYGCHGGRTWYRIAYPFARNPWPEMPEGTPEWAKSRSLHSESRFLKVEPKL